MDKREINEGAIGDGLLARIGSLTELDPSERLAWVQKSMQDLETQRARGAEHLRAGTPDRLTLEATIGLIDVQLHWLRLLQSQLGDEPKGKPAAD